MLAFFSLPGSARLTHNEFANVANRLVTDRGEIRIAAERPKSTNLITSLKGDGVESLLPQSFQGRQSCRACVFHSLS